MSTVMSESLPSLSRLFTFAAIVPAAVMALNTSLVVDAPIHLRVLYYPTAAASIALLGWCSGTFLNKAGIAWIVFAWSLALLDLLTLVASRDSSIRYEFAYVLLSAEVSLLSLWAILGTGDWQSRVPVVIGGAIVIAILLEQLSGGYSSQVWAEVTFLTAGVVAALCGGLRYLGFKLRGRQALDELMTDARQRTIQFGVKHMLIWMTLTGPLVLAAQSINLPRHPIFSDILFAISTATVSLIAIWAVLGSGFWPVRVFCLFTIPFAVGKGLTVYSSYLKQIKSQGNTLAFSIEQVQIRMHDIWIMWMFFEAALLAALLVFFRARGYRLEKTSVVKSAHE
jgi:hypothetical protein